MEDKTSVNTQGLTALMGQSAAYRDEYIRVRAALQALMDASDPTEQEKAYEQALEVLRRKPLC